MGKGKHISEDEIRYIVSAETSKAQQEIHTLTKATSALKKEERERRKAMIELEAQGKKNTDEYRKLSKECKDYTHQISANNKKIEEMRKKLDINAMSMNQLKKQAKDLRTQLDNMSQALNPQEYAALEQQLRKVNERMGDLKNGAKNIAEIAKSEGTISVMMGNLFTKVAEWAGNTLGKMKDIALEGIEMAASADGVTKAFRAMDDGTMLGKLRKATKDTVTDLDLMKAAVQAKDFRIPLEDLGKYLQFAQLKAQQTGQSVDFMTQSIVTGLGRKSVMILDNLGLSAAEINEEMAKTGDFMSAVAAIVDKQLAAAGDNYVSAADRAMQKSVEFKNAQQELGETLLPLKERWDDVYGGMEIGTMQLIGWIVKHRASIVTLATAITAYVAVQKVAAVWNAKHASSTMLSVAAEKLQAIQVALSRKAFLAKLIVMDLYKGRCNLATAATEMFNIVLKASPLAIITTLAVAAAAALYMFGSKVSVADKSVNEFNKKLAVERTSLNSVFEELKKTNPGTTERSRLVQQLNDKYPDLIKNYKLESANLKEITRAQNDANLALTNRIATEMKAQSISDYIKENVTQQIDTEDRLMKTLESTMNPDIFNRLKAPLKAFFSDSTKNLDDFKKKFGTLSNFNEMRIGTQVGFINDLGELRDYQKELPLKIDEINKKYEPYIQSIKTVTALSDEELKRQVEATSKLKKLEEERQHVQDTWFESDDEEKARKNRKLEELDNEIKKLRELGTLKAGTDLKKSTDKQSDEEKKKILETEKNVIQSLNQLREDELDKADVNYKSSFNAYKVLLQNKKISQEQYNIFEATATANHADEVLRIETEYQKKNEELAVTNQELKESAVKEANKRVLQAEQESFTNRLQAEQVFQSNIEGMRSFVGKQLSQEEELKAQLDIQLSLLDAYYKASLDYARKNGKDESEVTALYNRAKADLQKKYYDEKNKLAEHSSKLLHGMSGNELAGDVENLLNAISSIKSALNNLSDPEFWKKFGDDVYKNMQIVVSSTAKMLSTSFNTFKDVELNNIDEKYNAEIEAAQGNAEEIERLEKEKAQKKLDVEKKYADVQFAIKVSEIIASTGLSIMQAFAQLGPIGGAIAAALMVATSAIQITAANAERNKVKNMTLSGSSSSSKTGTRVASGRESGGKIDVQRAQDGKLFKDVDYEPNARGFIDKPTVIVGEGPAGKSKEWVASNAAVENPTVAPILNMIDKSQQAGNIRTLDLNNAIKTRMAGFSAGGSISAHSSSAVSEISSPTGLVSESTAMKFTDAINRLVTNGVPASVVLTDLERKQKLRDQVRLIGSKKE